MSVRWRTMITLDSLEPVWQGTTLTGAEAHAECLREDWRLQMLRDTKELVGMTDKAPTCTFKRLPARLTRWQVGNSLAFENYKLGRGDTMCHISPITNIRFIGRVRCPRTTNKLQQQPWSVIAAKMREPNVWMVAGTPPPTDPGTPLS